jgi:hypothetical protein
LGAWWLPILKDLDLSHPHRHELPTHGLTTEDSEEPLLVIRNGRREPYLALSDALSVKFGGRALWAGTIASAAGLGTLVLTD